MYLNNFDQLQKQTKLCDFSYLIKRKTNISTTKFRFINLTGINYKEYANLKVLLEV